MTDVAFMDDGAYGEVVWASVNGDPPIVLPVIGRALRWGLCRRACATPTNEATAEPETSGTMNRRRRGCGSPVGAES